MSEKRLLSCILTEGVLLLCLGMGILTLPKITPVSFGLILSVAFLIYGGFKAINSYIMKNYSGHFILNIVAGCILFFTGLVLCFAHVFNIMLIILLIGTYFILESISSSAFAFRGRNLLRFRYSSFVLSFFQLLLGLITITVLPIASLWIIGIMCGIDFLISGVFLINIYFATTYRY